MDIKQLKKELGLSNKDLSECFNMSYNSFANSTAKERYENALLSFYKLAKKALEKNKTKKQIIDNYELSNDQQLIIHGVSNRRELLLDFADLVMINDCEMHTREERELAVNRYLKGKL